MRRLILVGVCAAAIATCLYMLGGKPLWFALAPTLLIFGFMNWELFAAAPRSYRDEVLPPGDTRRVSIEAGVSLGWDRWVGTEGAIIAIDRYGASAPAAQLFPAFGFTAAHVASVARQVMIGDLRGVVSAPFEHAAPGAPKAPTPPEAPR